MTDIFEGLNSRQKEAVTATEGRIRVVAGAGTGKTKALTHRYAYLVNVLVCGIATEYCVRNTAEDLLKDGFQVYVLKDALAWVDADGHVEALKAMEEEGIHLI